MTEAPGHARCVSGRRTRRALFRHRHEAARSRAPRSSSSSATGPTTPSAGAWCCRMRRSSTSTASDPESAEAHPPRVRLLGRHRRLLPRHRHALVGPRLLRHRPQAPAQHPAGSGRARSASTLQFETEFDERSSRYRGYDLVVAADGANSKIRSALAHVFKPDIDVRACKYIWLGTRPAVRRRLHLHLRGDRARLDLGARLPVRCRDGDLHRRMLGGDLAPVRLRRA